LHPSLLDKDEFEEAEYSPVHFEISVVMQLLRHTIKEKRTNQKFVLLEGLCNSSKLLLEDDKLEIRFMDEFFNIEQTLGDVKSIISLQFQPEKEYISEDLIEYIKFEAPPPVVIKEKKNADDEDEDAEEAPAEDEGEGGEPKVAEFKPEDYKWTITNKKPKNMP
jgi:hypothetical protein